MTRIGLGLVLGSLAFLSACQKETVTDTPGSDLELGYTKAARPRSYTLVRDEINGPSCPSPASNCTKITLLTVNDDHGVRKVLDATATGNQATIIDAFRNERSSLSKVMDEADIDAVILGSLTAGADTGADATHYVILSTSTKVEVAYPFKYE